MKKMLKISLVALLTLSAFTFTGCDASKQGDTVSINCGDGGCGDVTVGDGNEYHYANDGTGANDPYFGDVPYDATFNKAECNQAGYFFCSIEQKCLNKPLTGGSCTASK